MSESGDKPKIVSRLLDKAADLVLGDRHRIEGYGPIVTHPDDLYPPGDPRNEL